MKNILFIAYPQYADFEIAHTLFFIRKSGRFKVTTVTVDGKPVESLAGLITMPQAGLSETDVEKYDLILISGGDGVHTIIDDASLSSFLQKASSKQIPIAAICASATLLGKAGLLKGEKFTCTENTYKHFNHVFEGAIYTGTNIEVGTNIITAKGTAFAEFTVAVGNLLGIWKDNKQSDWAFQFCKGNV
ncbi:DJ-1/PfpI family protein [Heyndrickxia sp. NPDC080065]|uniref:DJ-1/PfpI family protein n=1 Tax=Heyndrickxia sp. NPDC080065 TaxID=3390568 RepID=UPI003CFBFF9A